MPAALGLQVLFGLLTTSQPHLKGPQIYFFFVPNRTYAKYIFQPSIYGKSLQHPKKNIADDHLGKTSLCKGLPSGTCCLPCCDVSSLKLGDEWQKLVASTSRLVS